jgi:hypothetical protein
VQLQKFQFRCRYPVDNRIALRKRGSWRFLQSFAQQRYKLSAKPDLVTMPPPWIRKLKVQAAPVSLILSSYHICADRPDNRDNNFRAEFSNCSGKTNFTRTTRRSACAEVHLVDRLTTKIHEITPEGAKRIQKFLVSQVGEGGKKCIPDSPVEP